MSKQLTIGAVAKQTGVSCDTIRYYEAEGVLPAPARTDAGYRLYGPTDVRRLHLIRRVRLLGVPLPEVKQFVDEAFASECGAYGRQLLALVERQRADIDRRIAALEDLRADLDTLVPPARQVGALAPPGLTVAVCGRCPLVDAAGSLQDYCRCHPPEPPPGTARAALNKGGRRRAGWATLAAPLLLCLACCLPPLAVVGGVVLAAAVGLLSQNLWVALGGVALCALVLGTIGVARRYRRARTVSALA